MQRVSARGVRIWTSVALALAGAATVVVVRMPADAAESGLRLDQTGLTRLAELAAAAPDDFAGATVDPATGAVAVRYPDGRGAAPTRAKVASLATGARTTAAGQSRPVTFTAAKYSTRELDAVMARITADRSWLPDAGKSATGWWVDVASNTVMLSVTEVTPAVVAAAERTFGDRVRAVVGAQMKRTSRIADSEPFAGGSVVFNEAGDGCTTAFEVQRTDGSGQTGLMTAGHCFAANGEDVTRLDFGAVGVIAERENASFGFDRAIVTGRTYRPEVYVGGPDDDAETTIVRAVPILPGMRLCADGAVTLQNCTGIVEFVNACFNFGGQFTCNVAGMSSQSRLGDFGDSGGPVIMYQDDRTDTGPAFAMGMILGGGPDGTGRQLLFHPVNAMIPAGWQLVTSQ